MTSLAEYDQRLLFSKQTILSDVNWISYKEYFWSYFVLEHFPFEVKNGWPFFLMYAIKNCSTLIHID